MSKIFFNLVLLMFLILAGCNKVGTPGTPEIDSIESSFAAENSKEIAAIPTPGGNSDSDQSGIEYQPGVITAGEWNDLDNWSFWKSVFDREDFKKMPAYWSFFNENRISVVVFGTDGNPQTDVPVTLKKNGEIIFSSKTNNAGRAELFAGIFQKSTSVNYTQLTVDINNGEKIISDVKPFEKDVNRITITPRQVRKTIEIAYVVDATGSMGDELEYLKTELQDVISRVQSSNPAYNVATSSVFYRDEGDEYLTRISGFTNNPASTIDFIKQQSASGGGDYPEAVHAALDKAVNGLQWSVNAKARILFLVLDAPPHYENHIIASIQSSVTAASKKGVRIIPVTASGIDKETEFLMRFLSVTTNGTYVFITNDSGIGNDHLQPTIGSYQVEYLNNLMVRLINKYVK